MRGTWSELDTYDDDCLCGQPAIAFHSVEPFCEECLEGIDSHYGHSGADGMVAYRHPVDGR